MAILFTAAKTTREEIRVRGGPYRGSLAAHGKPGIGVVFDLRAPRCVRAVRIVSPSPGFSFQIRAGHRAHPLTLLAAPTAVMNPPVLKVATSPTYARYGAVWITELPPNGRLALQEVTVLGTNSCT